MINEIYTLYKKALPDIERGEEKVKSILSDKENHIIAHRDGENLAGVSVINENTIYLLCVDQPYRNRGIGNDLLVQSEKYIASRGFEKIVLGTGKEYILPGVPMNDGAHMFFQKRGYIHSWGDTGCFDMAQMLKDFTYDGHSAGDTIDEITYRWAAPCDLDKVVLCISDAEPKFLSFYRNEKFYQKGTERPILIAEKDGEVWGAILLYISYENEMGSVGAVATAHRHRNKGIATNMVRLGTKYLKDIGLKRACLGYTYTQIVHMYAKAGYKVSVEYYMGEKQIKG